ncbi:MAG: T9SS type A sorting domain-containing protein [Chitinophagaceae bacterium]|nr:T9SS type A sorting domain-containing protein [Chitinophagaceae bacterium]MCB9046859.1 T9SS type A sorting domain-containing protein [Chitinophagales bacterium]
MKKILLAVFSLLAINAMAAPGDTTWVQAHNDIWMDHNGAFDTTVEFPDGSKSYRKIMMIFTLGKYQCPVSAQYCGDWDYTVSLHIRPKTGDTMELARFITPYANVSYARFPWTWKERYEFDVTDFYNELKDSGTVRISYSGYSWGFTGNVKFAMIEGTPPRNVLGVTKAWGTSSRFGDTSAAQFIENKIDTKSLTAPANTQSAELMFTVSGHGSDNNGCCEFSKKYYEVKLNGNKFDKTEMWRDDCGLNHLYPQSGTWIYERGNWCPGDIVFPNFHKLSGVTGGNTFDLDVDFEYYIGSGSWGSYIVQGNVFYYGGFNKTLDASLDDIIAPSDHEKHYRYNPYTGRPMVEVQNTGSTTITSIKFKYEMVGGSGQKEYIWNGSLAPLEKATVKFDPLLDLRTITGTHEFNVEIAEVNGKADDDATNNKFSSSFTAAKQLPTTFVVEMFTNASVSAGVSETSWKIVDQYNDNVLAKRENCAPNTTYRDTVSLTVGVFKLVVEDAGCDGLSWWANSSAGSGYLKVVRTNSPLPYQLDGYFSGDFGCGFTQYFNVLWPNEVQDVTKSPVIAVYPNPAQNTIKVSLDGVNDLSGQLQLKDMMGRTVLQQHVEEAATEINISAMPNGVYTVVYVNSTGTEKLQARVVVAR